MRMGVSATVAHSVRSSRVAVSIESVISLTSVAIRSLRRRAMASRNARSHQANPASPKISVNSVGSEIESGGPAPGIASWGSLRAERQAIVNGPPELVGLGFVIWHGRADPGGLTDRHIALLDHVQGTAPLGYQQVAVTAAQPALAAE